MPRKILFFMVSSSTNIVTPSVTTGGLLNLARVIYENEFSLPFVGITSFHYIVKTRIKFLKLFCRLLRQTGLKFSKMKPGNGDDEYFTF